jgi:hypothetical protein
MRSADCWEELALSPHSPIADYLNVLARELAFDPALSRRVRREVEDHLREAATTGSTEAALEAERRAIAKFGNATEIAAQYRAAALYARVRRSGAWLIVGAAGVFFAMKVRGSWYGLIHWEISRQFKMVSGVVLPVDRYAFLLGAMLGIAGWLYIRSRPIPRIYRRSCHDHLRRCQILIGAAAVGVSTAVAMDAFLTIFRLLEAQWSSAVWLPAGSLLAEIALTVAIAVHLRNTARRMAGCQFHREP